MTTDYICGQKQESTMHPTEPRVLGPVDLTLKENFMIRAIILLFAVAVLVSCDRTEKATFEVLWNPEALSTAEGGDRYRQSYDVQQGAETSFVPYLPGQPIYVNNNIFYVTSRGIFENDGTLKCELACTYNGITERRIVTAGSDAATEFNFSDGVVGSIMVNQNN